MNEYLYHLQPKDMHGTVLRPLNHLKTTNPKLYETKVKKYGGREFLLERPIPVLDCVWNDVLHLSPVDPAEWKQAFKTAGMPEKPFTFFQIPLNQLDTD